MEIEADRIGLILMDKAQYNIHEAPRVWDRMSAANRNLPQPVEFLSTHPADEKRKHMLQQWVKEIEEKHKHLGE